MPRFSVVIACYNAADTLPATFASLRAQTERDWEAICVDDGSTDETYALLRREAARDSRIRVLTQANAGPSRARNAGVARARADWIAFLDADDLWMPEKLAHVAKLVPCFNNVAAVYGQIAFHDPRGDRTSTCSTVTPGPTSLHRLAGENPVCTMSNLCVRRRVFEELGGFRDDMRYSEDLEFLIRLVAAGHALVGIPTLMVRYSASFDGLSADLAQMHAGWRQAVRSAGAALGQADLVCAEAIHLRYLARRALRLGGSAATACTLALRGVRMAPRTFLGDGHRGPLTLLACIAAPVLPSGLRRRLFA